VVPGWSPGPTKASARQGWGDGLNPHLLFRSSFVHFLVRHILVLHQPLTESRVRVIEFVYRDPLSLSIMIHNSPMCLRKGFICVPYFHIGHWHSNLPNWIYNRILLYCYNFLTGLVVIWGLWTCPKWPMGESDWSFHNIYIEVPSSWKVMWKYYATRNAYAYRDSTLWFLILGCAL
jgi:hypothetical protein